MFIALVGPPCAGKDVVARFLQQELGFQRTRLVAASHHARAALGDDDEATNDSISVRAEKSDLLFDNADALLEHATVHWRQPLLTLDLSAEADVRAFLKRPFFLLVAIQAPLGLRWKRYQSKYATLSSRAKTLEHFVALDDRLVYGTASEAEHIGPSAMSDRFGKLAISAAAFPSSSASDFPLTPPASNTSASLDRSLSNSTSSISDLLRSRQPEPLASLFPKAALVLTNAYTSIADLHTSLHELQLPASLPTFLRPAWDHYFLSLCSLASLRSNCMKRRVGAVLVRSNRVLSTGYNGTPRGMKNCNEGGCGRCNGGAPGGARLDECLCLHAEENALLECGRERGGAEGTVLYCNTCPCLRCAVKIVQTSVREVVYELDYSMDDRSRQIFEEAGIKFRKCSLPTAQR